MKLSEWFFAARPLLHVPAWSIFHVALHDHHELAGKQFGTTEILLLLILSLTAAASLYLNQVYDLESDRMNHKLGFFSDNPQTLSAAQWAFAILNLLALAIAFAVSLRTVAIVIQWIVLGYLYSAPPFRLKDRPWLGLFANGYGVGWLTCFLVMPEISFHNAGLLGWDNPQYFLFSVAGVSALTTIPDRRGDARAGKRTVAVAYGPRWSAAISAVCFGLALYFAVGYNPPWQIWIAGVSLLLSLIALAADAAPIYRFAAKFPILLLTLLACWYYPFYALFMIALVLGTRLYYRHRYAQNYPSLN